MTKPKRKPVEAWASIRLDTGEVECLFRDRPARMPEKYRDVRLVEHDPRVAAVVKAAQRMVRAYREARSRDLRPEQYGPWLRAETAQREAVERMERKR